MSRYAIKLSVYYTGAAAIGWTLASAGLTFWGWQAWAVMLSYISFGAFALWDQS
jgi:hypothetical protein